MRAIIYIMFVCAMADYGANLITLGLHGNNFSLHSVGITGGRQLIAIMEDELDYKNCFF